MSKAARSIALLFILVPSLMLVSSNHAFLAEQQQSLSKHSDQHDQPRYRALPSHDSEGYVLREVDGQLACADSVPGEMDMFSERDPNLELRQISHVGEQITAQQTGLKILLVGTAQLDANPAAKQAFINAAARWEALIQNPITIIIDVDFGTTRFGVPYPGSDVLGATSSQRTGDSENYPDTRARLIAGASSTAETTLYNALPTAGEVATDIGSTAGVLAPATLFRALGALPAVADRASEQVALGNPPAIGFNSAFTFDFNPDDGITTNTTDFDAVAVHEIGHVLGFSSMVGSKESTPSEPVFVTVLDLFRFRPGTSLGTFPTAQRILSSGGEHKFFGGGAELGLSTGRPNGSMGDGRQASHWKDDALTGTHVGIMDPTIARGERETITSNDLLAYDAFGYRLQGGAPPPPDDAVALTSGVPLAGAIVAPNPGSGVLGATQYSIQVPAGATQLKIDLDGTQDVDLLVRYGAKVVIQGTPPAPVVDHVSESLTGIESLTIVPSTVPPLRAGTYYIGIGNFGPGAATFTVTATVTTGGGGPVGSPPAIATLAASLNGDVLTLTGSATDPDGDIVQGVSSLLDGANQVIATSSPFNVSFGSATSTNFTIGLTNINQFPTAVKGTLLLIDGQGNRSPAMTADFSQADAGGPTIKKVSVSGSKLTIKGKDLSGVLTLEINGVDVTTVSVSGSKKAKIGGAAASLRAGPNRIRVRLGTLRSNIVIFTQ